MGEGLLTEPDSPRSETLRQAQGRLLGDQTEGSKVLTVVWIRCVPHSQRHDDAV